MPTTNQRPRNKEIERAAYTCPHLHEFWQQGGLRDIVGLIVYIRLIKSNRGGTGVKLPESRPTCLQCNGCHSAISQLHGCLECVHFACMRKGHFRHHQIASDHALSIDIDRETFHCKKCNDYVYDWELDFELQNQLNTHSLRSSYMRRIDVLHQPTENERKLIKACSVPVRERASRPLGLRGMQNLGNSCFMTVALHSLVANPFLRNYFLGDMHHPSTCAKRRLGDECLACELANLFALMFNGQEKPYSPHRFLYAVWNESKHLSGYRQQDAHEFLSVEKEEEKRKEKEKRCMRYFIVHESKKSNRGSLRSDVTCLKCQRCSSSIEPMFYICLDIYFKKEDKSRLDSVPPTTSMQQQQVSSVMYADNGDDKNDPPLTHNQQRNTNTSSFEKKSKIQGVEPIYLSCAKQMTMHELPPTLTFQLKRFCQQPSTKRWYKNKSHISFPLDGLDLSAFSKQQQTKMAIEKNGEKTGSSFSYPQLYDLYSVIVHKGTLENGHYICYIRKKNTKYSNRKRTSCFMLGAPFDNGST
eukprot:jgi/Bigna1/129303/aug1.8_g4011